MLGKTIRPGQLVTLLNKEGCVIKQSGNRIYIVSTLTTRKRSNIFLERIYNLILGETGVEGHLTETTESESSLFQGNIKYNTPSGKSIEVTLAPGRDSLKYINEEGVVKPGYVIGDNINFVMKKYLKNERKKVA